MYKFLHDQFLNIALKQLFKGNNQKKSQLEILEIILISSGYFTHQYTNTHLGNKQPY